MPPNNQQPKKRFHFHIFKPSGVCDESCRTWRLYDRLLPTAFLFGVLCFLVYFLTLTPPLDFPSATLFKVHKNEPVETVALRLKEKHIIRSTKIFIYLSHKYGVSTSTREGEYFFPESQSVVTLARRFARGNFELIPFRVTLPEGINTFQMADILAKKIPDFDKTAFLDLAVPKEGYLFPDTYFFVPDEDPLLVIEALEENFKKKISEPTLARAIATSGLPLADIVTMASLLEKEANNTHDRQLIAGILWKRISIHMPLQVDAVFPYIIGKNTFQLTRSDLRTSSPYNTYTNKGLPAGPIANPGVSSLLAAVTPVKTKYLFYLSDMQSNFHFSETYAEQLVNQKKYLNN